VFFEVDEELGRSNVANRISNQVLDRTKQDFFNAIQRQYGIIEKDQMADEQTTDRIIQLWRAFLVGNRLSTTILL